MPEFPLDDLYTRLELFWRRGQCAIHAPNFWAIFAWPIFWRRCWLVLFPITIPATSVLWGLQGLAGFLWWLGGMIFAICILLPPFVLYGVAQGIVWLWTVKR